MEDGQPTDRNSGKRKAEISLDVFETRPAKRPNQFSSNSLDELRNVRFEDSSANDRDDFARDRTDFPLSSSDQDDSPSDYSDFEMFTSDQDDSLSDQDSHASTVDDLKRDQVISLFDEVKRLKEDLNSRDKRLKHLEDIFNQQKALLLELTRPKDGNDANSPRLWF
jgi:hypothetical protein